MEKGRLAVHTENILPVIKKWLYSEKEIFVRELVSNAFDAITKLKKVSLSEEIRDPGDQDFRISIKTDKERKALVFEDNGVGMSREEVVRYITQIAFSGAEEFVKKFEESQDKTRSGIIGNFGLGFYSAFMVSRQVEIDTLSYRNGEAPVRWISSGGEEYEIGEGSRTVRGTTITLFLDEDSEEMLDKERISGLVRRYLDFIPVPVTVDGEEVNRRKALWTESPSSLKKEDYIDFYHHLYPYQGDPLFWIHLNVDHPFRLQGILYFPRLAHEMDLNKSQVKIYCKQVFVSDEAQELIPKFLTVLQGVVDLPDLPLNVSRSYVQNDPVIKKIANHIIKKVSDRLLEEKNKDRENYEKIWDEISAFVKYGLLSDDKFWEQAKDAVLYKLVSDPQSEGSGEDKKSRYLSLEDYLNEFKEKSDKKIYYINDAKTQRLPMKLLAAEGIGVVLLNALIDTHFIQLLERKNPDVKFVRVDGEVAEKFLDSSSVSSADEPAVKERIQKIFEKAVGKDGVTVRVENMKDAAVPAMIMVPEQMRRFSEMTAHMSRGEDTSGLFREHTLVLNARNSLIRKIAGSGITDAAGDATVSEGREKAAKYTYLLAKMHQGSLSAEELDTMMELSLQYLEKQEIV